MKKTTFLKNWKNNMLSLLAFALFFSFANAQNPNVIQFQDETIEIQENIDTFEWNQMPESSRLANGYFGWVQFYETPTQDIQDAFKNNDLQLIDYIPHQTYLFYFPETTSIQFLADSGVRAVIPVEGRFKLSSNLRNGIIGEWAIDGDNILVTLVHHKNVNTSYVINELAALQITLVRSYDNATELELSIPNNCLEALSNLPFVKWVDVTYAPPVLDDERGRSLHRSNGLDTQTGAGRNYTGAGVGVMTRDLGDVGPHVDFYGRITNLYGSAGNTHGDWVSGCMAGAGNKDPQKRGSAAGADLYVVGYTGNFLDPNTTTLINDGTVQVTVSAFSQNCNGGYTSSARTVDTQVFDLETMQHVFSAGNSNGTNCGYGAGSQWGNITGGHKQGKNVTTVGATSYTGNIASFSSRGPAHDGRIKPDISGHGLNVDTTAPNHNYTSISGTSFSAPYTAGVTAQLYEVYMDANGGNLPKSALIKAAILNTANDAGNVGPDFKYGWGIVNALRAGKMIEDGRYLSDDVSQGNTNTHNITVPSGTTQVRIMVYWNDVPASIGANPALVNDLDLLVTDPNSTVFEPWLLDSTPDPVLLDLPAGNGPDHLNNMEQVLINNPVQGTYDIDITGFNVPTGPQEYWVVWEMITENLTVTYPNGGEKFFRNGSLLNVIQWDAINTTASFLVEYTVNGTNWNTIGTVGATTYQFNWQAPDVYTGDAKIRVTSGAFSDESDDPFNITASRVASPNIIQVCETDATFTWADMPEAESYDLLMMGDDGDKFMEIVGNTTETTITVPIADYEAEQWYAVAPRNDAVGWVGLRTIARIYGGGLLDCVILGEDDNDITNSVVLYPNPATDEFIVNLGSSVDSDVEITVINSLGQTIQRLNTSTTQTTVDVSNYHTGIYFVSIKTDTQSTTKKLLVR
jgi:subtilase family protein/type IX secretion system substrate protein